MGLRKDTTAPADSRSQWHAPGLGGTFRGLAGILVWCSGGDYHSWEHQVESGGICGDEG